MTGKRTRRLRVNHVLGSERDDVPRVLLQGRWLRELGFACGDPIKITVANNMLFIVREEPTR